MSERAPHCDPDVLHAPGVCEFCDRHPEEQRERVRQGVNFTGENDPLKKPCPAWAKRGPNCQVWAGNTPYKTTKCTKCGEDCRDNQFDSGLCFGCELDRCLDEDYRRQLKVCDCGADKVGSPTHSYWCSAK